MIDLKRTYIVVCLIGILIGTVPCSAFNVPQPKSLTQMVASSTAIAVLRIDSMELKQVETPKPDGYIKSKEGKMLPIYIGSSTLQLGVFQPEGVYKFTLLKNIKGDIPAELTVSIPSLNSEYYTSAFEVNTGIIVLAFFNQTNGIWTPDEILRPFVPLKSLPSSELLQGKVALAQVESLLLEELKNPTTRQMAAAFLSSSVGPNVVLGLAPYAQDADETTRDYILMGLAQNKQLNAINRIRDLNRVTSMRSSNARSMVSLRKFSGVKAALPLINPLLFENEPYIRINALDTLSQTPDASSLPFLLLTIYDPEHQKVNAPTAYALFWQIVGANANYIGDDFARNSDVAWQESMEWWQDELAGKHPAAEGETEPPAVSLRQLQKFEASDLPQLNQGLFMLSETTRRAAARGLEQFADGSSIPYLLIALYDPQPDIAFSAYATLHRVVPTLGAASRVQWETERPTQTKLAFEWWQQHLIDAEKKQLAF